MKVCAINGSSRKDGNTAIILQTVLDVLEREGVETELVQLASADVGPCRGCFTCRGKERCSFHDDFNGIFEKVVQADGLLLGSPVYSADASALMRAFLERAAIVCTCNPGLVRHRVGAAVAAVRRAGGISAVDSMNHFLLNHEFFVVGSTYWNMVYGMNPGDVRGDAEGIANMVNLGRNMAFLLRKLKGNA